MVNKAVLFTEVAVLKLEGGAHVPEDAVHLGAGRGSLGQTPLLAARPVADGVCWISLSEVSFYVCCRATFRTLNKSCATLILKEVANGNVLSYHKFCSIFLQGWNIDDHNAVNDNNSAKNAVRIDN